MKMKRFMVLGIVGCLLLGAVGCSSDTTSSSTSGGSSSGSSSSGNGAATEVETGEIDISEFVTLNMHIVGDPPPNRNDIPVQNEINKILKERVNAELQFQWIEWTDWYTKYNLLFASGEPMDLIVTSSTWLDAWPNAERGGFTELDELLPVYAPITWESVPEEVWDYCRYNDRIVIIPENEYTQWVDHGFIYRGDWAEEFGITEPITDWETMGLYFEGVKQNKPDAIPWDSKNDGETLANFWFDSHTDSIGIGAVVTGKPVLFYGKSYDDPYTVYSPFFEDVFVDFAITMKEWGDAGYWREDVLNNTADTREMFKIGRSGADQHHTETFFGLKVDVEKQNPEADVQFFPFQSTRNMYIKTEETHGAMGIGRSSKNPERALMVYDILRNDKEVHQLLLYGIEGENYILTEDGRRQDIEGYNQSTDEYFSNFWAGRMDEHLIPHVDEYEGKQDVFDEREPYAKSNPYAAFTFDRTAVDAEMAALTDVCARLLPAIYYGKAGDPVEAVEDFRNQLKMAGFDKVLEEVQRQMDELK